MKGNAKAMNLLVIGDVHGAYYTLQELLEEYWDKETEQIVQVGDLIDRGNYSAKVVKLCRQLEKEGAVFLKGNHEYEMVQHILKKPDENWLKQHGKKTLRQYKSKETLAADVWWMKQRPLYWENDFIFISHGGIAEEAKNPFRESSQKSVLWNRGKIKNIGKLQIYGHAALGSGKPKYNVKSNAWNVDTAASYGAYLSALRLSPEGEVLEQVRVKADKKDWK